MPRNKYNFKAKNKRVKRGVKEAGKCVRVDAAAKEHTVKEEKVSPATEREKFLKRHSLKRKKGL